MYEFHFDNTKVLIPKKPDLRYLYLEITTGCNLKCKMCFKQYWEDDEGDMDYSLFLKILEDAEEFPDLHLIVFGGIGEPTVHPHFMEMVKEVKNRGYALGVTTNGAFLTEKRLKKLVELRTDIIYFSIDSIPTQRIDLGHQTSALVLDRIKKIVDIKKELKTEFPHIGVEFVITKENYKGIFRIAKFLKDYNVDILLFSNILPLNERMKDMIVYDGSVDIEDYVEEIHRKAYFNYVIKVPEFKMKTERHCDFIEEKAAVIRWDGEVSPCYRFLHTYTEYIFGRPKRVEAFSFGNVREKSLKEIWTSREYSWFRFIVKNSLYPSCTDCSLVNYCDFAKDTEFDCWGNSPSCADCLWARRIIMCPVPEERYKRFW